MKWAIVVVVMLASACGARSALREGSGNGGQAGTSSASSGVGGGTGGAAAVTCGAVVQASSVVTVDGPGGDAVQPSLVVLASIPPKAAVAYVWNPSALASYTTARVASFAGWGTWPPPALVIANVEGTSTGQPLSSVSLLAQSNPSRSPPSLDLLFSPTTIEDGNFDNQSLTFAGVGLDGSTPFTQSPAPGTVQFLATGGTNSGLVWPGDVNLLSGVVLSREESGSPLLDLVVQAGPNFGGGTGTLGCSTTTLAADAVTNPTGWLVAAGLGSPLTWNPSPSLAPPCVTGPSVGPGTALTLATMGGPGSVAQTQVLPMASSITRIRMANRTGGGTWIVWSLDGVPTLTAGLVSGALALDPMFPVAAAHGPLVPTSFAVESLGDSLVVAGVEELTGSNDQVQVVAMDETGATVWSATVPTEGTVEGALSLRAAPDGSALLLAWSELPAGGTTHRVRVARLDCTTCAADSKACATGSDCCSGTCEAGACASTLVTTDLACKSDADCVGAACDPLLGTCVGSVVCASDADCTYGNEFCDTTIAVCIPSGSVCSMDDDCPAGQLCDEQTQGCLPGTCVSTGGACTSGHQCCSQTCGTSTGTCN